MTRSRLIAWSMGVWCVLAAGADGVAQTGDPLGRLAWMSGSWVGTIDGVAMEEHWTGALGGSMLGMHRDVRDGQTIGFEFARIVLREGTPVFLASPGGAPPTPFTAVETGERRVVFENRGHDFPQRIVYWREGDVLHARVEGAQQGAMTGQEWAWRRGTLSPNR